MVGAVQQQQSPLGTPEASSRLLLNECQGCQEEEEEEELSGASANSSSGSSGAPSPRQSKFSFVSDQQKHSVSERSAIYKQRIDSLFGRPSRINPFKPNMDRFCIRIDGTGVSLNPIMGSGGFSSSKVLPPRMNGKKREKDDQKQRMLTSDEDDEDGEDDSGHSYQKIKENRVVTESLNKSALTVNGGGMGLVGSSTSHMLLPPPHPLKTHLESPGLNGLKVDCEESPSVIQSPRGKGDGDEASPSQIINSPVSTEQLWRNGNYSSLPVKGSPILDIKHQGGRPSPSGSSPRFTVEYLGSVPVEGNTTSLGDLQIPLRGLYMDFLKGRNLCQGQLSITTDGLRFEGAKRRLVNPFTTIAVWAAIKFVTRLDGATSGECAFMPLISDPEGQDKSRLFGPMDGDLAKIYVACLSSRIFRNPPIFACVMREAAFNLECHAFVCKCAEDAIVIAANLYQSLVDKMRCSSSSAGKKEGESGYGTLTRNSPANPPQETSGHAPNCEKDGSSHSEECTEGSPPNPHYRGGGREKLRVVFSDSESLIPVRPPRKKKKGGREGELKRYNSDDTILRSKRRGPQRRKSFKAPHHHWQGRAQAGGASKACKKRVKIKTPAEEIATSCSTSSLGDPTSDSIDQVLDRIVNPGGMSWNDLKPSYQEMILKIALTLTQDQLYQKSKQAMKKHQNQQGPGRKSKVKSKSSEATAAEESQFLNQLLKSFSKNKPKVSPKPQPPPRPPRALAESKIGLKVPINTHQPPVLKKRTGSNKDDPLYSFCSGCVCENCSDKCYCSLPSKTVGGKAAAPGSATSGGTCSSTSALALTPNGSGGTPSTLLGSSSVDGGTPLLLFERRRDEDEVVVEAESKKGFSSLRRRSNVTTPKKKSCGYDTESCAETDKCYCSLKMGSNGLKIYNINLDTETSDTDTNSYDFEPFNSKGPKEEDPISLPKSSYSPATRFSYTRSPPIVIKHTTNALVHADSSGHVSDKQSQGEDRVGKREKVLLITGSSNPSARVIYKELDRFGTRRDTIGHGWCDSAAGSDGGESDDIVPDKMISIKKSAEIAAMFHQLRIDKKSSRCDVRHLGKRLLDTGDPEESNSLDFEASLGYLP